MELTKCRLGELITQRREKNDGSDLPICGVSKDGLIPPKQADADTSIYNVFYRNDFIFNPARMELNSIAINDKYERAICSSLYEVFYVHRTDLLLPHYLKLIVRQKWFTRYCEFLGQGSAREYCRFSNISEIEVEFPPIAEQKKIVNYYASLQERIRIKKRINDNLTEQCCTDYIKMLNGYTTDSTDLPGGWSIGSIGNYCDVKSGYAFKSDWWTDNGYKVIKIANIVNNSIDLDSCDCVIAEHAVKANNFYVKSGDILIAMTGATTGKIGIVPLTDEPIVVNQRVGKFFLGENPIEKAPFLYSTLLYSRVVHHLQPDGTAGSAQDNLSADNIKDIAIVLPDNFLIDSFNKQHIPHLKMVMSNWAEIRSLNKMAETLLQTLSSR